MESEAAISNRAFKLQRAYGRDGVETRISGGKGKTPSQSSETRRKRNPDEGVIEINTYIGDFI